jgi:hypothetical protein
LEVLSVLNILFETENGPLLEVNGLAHDLTKDIGVLKALVSRPSRLHLHLPGNWLLGRGLNLHVAGRLGCLVHKDAGALENLSLDLIRVQING